MHHIILNFKAGNQAHHDQMLVALAEGAPDVPMSEEFDLVEKTGVVTMTVENAYAHRDYFQGIPQEIVHIHILCCECMTPISLAEVHVCPDERSCIECKRPHRHANPDIVKCVACVMLARHPGQQFGRYEDLKRLAIEMEDEAQRGEV